MKKIITDLKDDLISMELTDKAKSILADGWLVLMGLNWVIGVDYNPILKVLGPIAFLGAMYLWFKYSNTWKSVSNFMDRGINGEFDE